MLGLCRIKDFFAVSNIQKYKPNIRQTKKFGSSLLQYFQEVLPIFKKQIYYGHYFLDIQYVTNKDFQKSP